MDEEREVGAPRVLFIDPAAQELRPESRRRRAWGADGGPGSGCAPRNFLRYPGLAKAYSE